MKKTDIFSPSFCSYLSLTLQIDKNASQIKKKNYDDDKRGELTAFEKRRKRRKGRHFRNNNKKIWDRNLLLFLPHSQKDFCLKTRE